MNITTITTFNQPYYDLIGRDCINSWLRYWPEHLVLTCYTEDMQLIPQPRINIVDYNCFDQRYDRIQNTLEKASKKFAKKAWSFIHAMENIEQGWLVWIDADVITHQSIDQNLLRTILKPTNLSTYLGVHYDTMKNGINGSWLVPETGFFAVNSDHPRFNVFREEYIRRYVENDFSGLRRSYDNDVFGAALQVAGAQVFDLCATLDKPYKTPLRHTILGPYLKHWKAKHSKQAYAKRQ